MLQANVLIFISGCAWKMQHKSFKYTLIYNSSSCFIPSITLLEMIDYSKRTNTIIKSFIAITKKTIKSWHQINTFAVLAALYMQYSLLTYCGK